MGNKIAEICQKSVRGYKRKVNGGKLKLSNVKIALIPNLLPFIHIETWVFVGFILNNILAIKLIVF